MIANHKNKTLKKELPKKVQDALIWIIAILEKYNITYHICGGLCARFYGSSRRINDIDIDVSEKDFSKIYESTKSYVVSGPELYTDKKWKVMLMTIKFNNQIIEFANADNIQLSNVNRSRWITFKYDFNDATTIQWKKLSLKLMSSKKMIAYKKYLDGDKQKEDIKAIKNYIHRQNKLIKN